MRRGRQGHTNHILTAKKFEILALHKYIPSQYTCTYTYVCTTQIKAYKMKEHIEAGYVGVKRKAELKLGRKWGI
jgi:hypothetical protein